MMSGKQWKQRKAQNEKLKKENEKVAVVVKEVKVEPKKNERKVIDKDVKKELQKTQREFQQLEERIATLTKQKATLEGALSSPEIYTDNLKFTQTETDYKKISEQLESANASYEIVFEKLMKLEN